MYEINEPSQPVAKVEPKRRAMGRGRLFLLNFAISLPIAVASAVGLFFVFDGLGWTVPAPVVGFVCGFGATQLLRIPLERRFGTAAEWYAQKEAERA